MASDLEQTPCGSHGEILAKNDAIPVAANDTDEGCVSSSEQRQPVTDNLHLQHGTRSIAIRSTECRCHLLLIPHGEGVDFPRLLHPQQRQRSILHPLSRLRCDLDVTCFVLPEPEVTHRVFLLRSKGLDCRHLTRVGVAQDLCADEVIHRRVEVTDMLCRIPFLLWSQSGAE